MSATSTATYLKLRHPAQLVRGRFSIVRSRPKVTVRLDYRTSQHDVQRERTIELKTTLSGTWEFIDPGRVQDAACGLFDDLTDKETWLSSKAASTYMTSMLLFHVLASMSQRGISQTAYRSLSRSGYRRSRGPFTYQSLAFSVPVSSLSIRFGTTQNASSSLCLGLPRIVERFCNNSEQLQRVETHIRISTS